MLSRAVAALPQQHGKPSKGTLHSSLDAVPKVLRFDAALGSTSGTLAQLEADLQRASDGLGM